MLTIRALGWFATAPQGKCARARPGFCFPDAVSTGTCSYTMSSSPSPSEVRCESGLASSTRLRRCPLAVGVAAAGGGVRPSADPSLIGETAASLLASSTCFTFGRRVWVGGLEVGGWGLTVNDCCVSLGTSEALHHQCDFCHSRVQSLRARVASKPLSAHPCVQHALTFTGLSCTLTRLLIRRWPRVAGLAGVSSSNPTAWGTSPRGDQRDSKQASMVSSQLACAYS